MEFFVNEKFKNGKKAAFCLSIDDVAPMSSEYFCGDLGGDLGKGKLGRLKWLLDRHPQARATLFTTADWREVQHLPTRKFLAKIPFFRNHFYLADSFPKGKFSLANHPEFVEFVSAAKNFEIALHGLSHTHKGPKIPVEFQGESKAKISKILAEMLDIFNASKIKYVKGFCPPAWNASENLMDALIDFDIDFLASSRDLNTPVSISALANMSGLKNVPLFAPSYIKQGKLIHFPVNFQATSSLARAFEIIESGGLLSVKGHISGGMLDEIKDSYINYLDLLMAKLEDKYGDAIFWTSMPEMASIMKTGQ